MENIDSLQLFESQMTFDTIYTIINGYYDTSTGLLFEFDECGSEG